MEPNFVLVKSPDPLALLVDAFPEVQHLLEDADYGYYYVYARFSEYLVSRAEDEQLWRRAYGFFETHASGNSGLRDLLIDVFENLCVDTEVAQRLKRNAAPATLALLSQMGLD
jgi:hypothetical protein